MSYIFRKMSNSWNKLYSITTIILTIFGIYFQFFREHRELFVNFIKFYQSIEMAPTSADSNTDFKLRVPLINNGSHTETVAIARLALFEDITPEVKRLIPPPPNYEVGPIFIKSKEANVITLKLPTKYLFTDINSDQNGLQARVLGLQIEWLESDGDLNCAIFTPYSVQYRRDQGNISAGISIKTPDYQSKSESLKKILIYKDDRPWSKLLNYVPSLRSGHEETPSHNCRNFSEGAASYQ